MHERNKNLFKKAFELAYFIHPDKELALEIARDALSKLEATSQAQFKRFYYKPTGRSGKDGTHRSKVMLQDPQLLQRLVYIESELVEIQQEQKGADLEQEDMAIRFIKHLIKLTLRRNSFYVTLGVSRLLHNYSTSETMDVFSLVVQDPERVRDDFYYRSRKKRLMKEFRERFGEMLKVVRGNRGEQRFEETSDQEQAGRLVKACLEHFTPWATQCVVKQPLDLYGNSVKGLSFDGKDPDEEHSIEINRIHAVIHPPCFDNVIASLGFDEPSRRLSLPYFYLADSENRSGRGGERRAPELSDQDYQRISDHMDKNRKRRKAGPKAVLSLRVDGREVARLGQGETSATFQIDDGAEFLEVYTWDGAFLAGSLLSGMDPMEPAHVMQVSLDVPENRLYLEFRLAGSDEEWDEQVFDVTASLEPHTHSVGAKLKNWGASIFRAFGGGLRPVMLVPVAGALALMLFLWQGDGPVVPPETGSGDFQSEQSVSDSSGPSTVTRGYEAQWSGLPLESIKKVQVLPLEETTYPSGLARALSDTLARHGFVIPEDLADCDAVLKDLSETESRSGEKVLALVNVSGDILWQVRLEQDQLTGDMTDLAPQILDDLLERINP